MFLLRGSVALGPHATGIMESHSRPTNTPSRHPDMTPSNHHRVESPASFGPQGDGVLCLGQLALGQNTGFTGKSLWFIGLPV
jgi:hypothetical protein